MPDEEEPRRKHRRRKPRRLCARYGCGQLAATSASVSGQQPRYCCIACRSVDIELIRAQRVCEAVGTGPVSGELWSCAVALSDMLSQYQQVDRRLKDIARSVGITIEQWQAIKHGSVNGSGTSGGGHRSRPRASS